MHIRRCRVLVAGKIWIVPLLGMVSVALVTPRSDVALGQSNPVTITATFDVTNSIETDAFGINSSGQIVGWFLATTNSAGASCTANPLPAGCVHGFLGSAAGPFTTIDPSNSIFTQAFGINDAGQIVGMYEDSGFKIHAFVRDPSTKSFTTIDDPSGVNTVAFGINGPGQIVGYFQDNNGNHGFVRDPATGNFTTLDDPNGVGKTRAFGINDAGQIVGAFFTPAGHGFLAVGGSFTTIDGPSASQTEAIGINNNGQIVGFFLDSGGSHGFLTVVGGAFTAFDVPNATTGSTFAGGINGNGQIAGYYSANSTRHGFLANGKPDPRLIVPQWFQAGIPGATDKAGKSYAPPLYTNFWGPFHYDKDLPNTTIGQVGCALTTLTMLVNFWKGNQSSPTGLTNYSLPNVPPLDPNSPSNLMWPNNWPGLFSKLPNQKGWVEWNNFGPQFVTYNHTRVYLCPSSGCPYPSFPILPQGAVADVNGFFTLDAATQTLINILRNGIPVILPILGIDNKDHHFVVVTGFDSKLGTFLVNDPGDNTVMTFYSVTDNSGNYVKDGNIIAKGVPNAAYASGDGITVTSVQNSLSKISGWKVYTDHALTVQDPLTPQALGIYTDAPVEFILTDPQGRRTGFDPISSTSFQEIPASAYSTSVYSDELNFSFVEPPVKSLDMAAPMAGQYTLNVVGTGSGSFTLEVTAADAAGNWITQTYSGMTAPGVSTQFTFQGAVTIFATFSAIVDINASKNQFAVGGQFTLGAGSPGIDPLTQPVTLLLGAFSMTIPAGSFHLDSHGNYVFHGTINGVQLAAGVQPQGGNQYAYGIAGQNANNLPTANPVDVRLATGSNGGDVSVNANFTQ